MGEEKQFKIRTKLIATRGVHEYRETIPALLAPDDIVLEIGCEWGTTTNILAQHCQTVLGTDISQECVDRARLSYPDLSFEVLDAFDVRAALDFGLDFTKVYIDMSGLSGYRSLLDSIALVNTYSTVLLPDAIVIKSGSLKQFASRCVPWKSPSNRFYKPSASNPKELI